MSIDPSQEPHARYEPPAAEDIDTGHGPAEAVAMVQQSPPQDSEVAK